MQQRKKELLEMKKSELLIIAKELNVNRYEGKNQLPKERLVDNIIRAELVDENVSDNIYMEDVEKILISEEERALRHKRYIDNVSVGTLVAFNTPQGKVKSAMVVKRSTKRRKLKVETKYNVSYMISFDDVIWVKTGTRWPRGVYNLLKGVKEDV